ncbi:hypothetical protein ACF3OB_07465 [Capnocytophaga canis]|uniref:hypothetical protein n=1 Tax=Capnocytophaga canis TaxID=1848903 RepID=UPI00370D4257
MFKRLSNISIPLFIVLPLAGFITSLFNVRSRSSAVVYVAFAALFGYAISFTNESADSYRYAIAFSEFDNTLNLDRIQQLYKNGELKDVYQLIVFYITSIFSSNPKVMYALAGSVYGIFSYLILKIFVVQKGPQNDLFSLVLAICFFTYISISNINGFKFWTGAIFVIYAIYQVFIQRKKVWLFGVAIVPLFHYGLLLLLPVLLLYLLTERYFYDNSRVSQLLFYGFILAFVVSWGLEASSINLSFLSQFSILSGAIGNRIDYLNDSETTAMLELRAENSTFLSVRKYFNILIKIYVFVVIVFMNNLVKRMQGINKIEYTRFFAFVLYFYSFAFIATSFPSGGRFMNMAHVFFFIFMAKLYAVYKKKKIQKLIILSLIPFSFSIAFTNGMLSLMILSPTFWYGNVFWIIYEGINFK